MYFLLDDRCQGYKTFQTSDRNLANGHKPNSQDCAQFTDGWYRFIGAAGTRLPTKCPDQIKSQPYPVWLNVKQNKLPHKGEGVKEDIHVCLPKSSSVPCVNIFKIKVQNCSDYLVYNLLRIPHCPYNYYGID